MASLTGNKIKDTYQGLLKTTDNAALNADGKEITDGAGNGTGVILNNLGDVTAAGTVAFTGLKDSNSDITITKFVDEADGIAGNNNDTTIPTSAAVKDYVDSNITAQDLDITDGTNTGSVDLDTQLLQFAGVDGTVVTVSGNVVTIDSTGLQEQITSNDDDIVAIEASINAEEAARLAGDNAVQANVTAEASTRAAADGVLQSNINAETAARIAADSAIEDLIDAETAARDAADNTLSASIATEQGARIAGDSTLQGNINTEAMDRATADAALQAQITSNDGDITALTSRVSTNESDIIDNENEIASLDTRLTAAEVNISGNDSDISGLDTRLTAAEGDIDTNTSDISGLDTRVTTAEANIASNDSDISGLDTRLTAAESNITSNDSDISGLDTRVTATEGAIASNDTDIADLDTRLTTAEGNITSNDTDISGLDTRLTTAEGEIDTLQSDLDTAESNITTLTSSKQSISEKGQANGYASLDSNGTVPTSQLPEAVTGALSFQGVWDASTNTPTLPDPTTVKGDYYKVSVEGTYLGEVFHVGDWALSDGVSWEHIHTQETISSVFGREGAVTAQEGDYSAFYPLLSDLAATDANVLANTTKLAGIEAGADVTDAANVAAAGAMMTDVASLADLSDVAGTLPVNGQILAYNGGTGTWGPVAAATAPVTSVNGEIGAVTLDADDINDAATSNKFVTAADVTKLGNIFVSQLVNLDTLESDVATNNAKISFDSTSSTKLAGIEAGAQVNTVDSVNSQTGAVVLDADDIDDTLTTHKFTTAADITKLGGIEAGAQVNTVDSVNSKTGAVVINPDDLDDAATTHKFTSQAEIDKLAGIEAGADVTDSTNVTSALGSISVTAHSDVTSAGSGAIITSAERTKLAGIEAGADITDTTNVVAALTAGTNINIAANGTISATDTNTTYTAGSGLSLSGTTFSHSDTSSAGNLSASGRRYVTGLTFDTYGHVTGYTTGTETVVNTNTTYSAGSGLTLSGTTFNIQSDLRGETWLIGRSASDYIEVYDTGINFVLDGTTDMRLYNSGDLHVEGNVIGYSTSVSDQKFKDDVTPIESALDKVKALKGVEYTWNATSKKGKRDLGFIAQEVEQIIPEIVTQHILSTGEFADNPTQSKTIDYEKITAVLVEAMKEQQKQIDELKAKLDGITN